jgi:hypothetical protein
MRASGWTAALLLALVTPAVAAEMPTELIGDWSNTTQSCQQITIERNGYRGFADSEGYACRLIRITRRPYIRQWTGELSCSGEDPKPARSSAVFHLTELEGKELLVLVTTSRDFTGVSALRRCTAR